MTVANPYATYKNQTVATLTPGELIIFLYDEMTMRINRAIVNLKKNKLEDAHTNILKAEDIVAYLADILDMKYPVSDQLLQLYEFIFLQLVQANNQKNPELLEDVLKITAQLKETWAEAESLNRKKTILEGKIV